MSHTTIKDIAVRLGLSTSTVSRALRNHPDISEETRKNVTKLAEELDYRPNLFAQGLKNQQSQIIGVIVPQVKHYFFSAIMSGITDVAYKAGYTVIICQSNEDFQREVTNAQTLLSQRVAGLLVSVSQNSDNLEHFDIFIRRNIPVVFFDRVPDCVNSSCVTVDDYQGAYKAVEYLVKQGYRRIAHIGAQDNLSISANRFKGYADALKNNNIPLDETLVVFTGLNEEHGMEGFDQLHARLDTLPDAIFAVTDPVAVGAFIRIKELKLRIPQDIALVGFSDNPVVSLIDPPMTTVHQPAADIGKTAAGLLFEHIQSGRQFQPKHVVLPTELIVRQST
ncbi:LacI family DNA-binding transcriptional regulator [candidate division KSB1 bacterium]|nr:LacI family DNA-binding transcriptional regulator [candidate division KSB1 bacterium]